MMINHPDDSGLLAGITGLVDRPPSDGERLCVIEGVFHSRETARRRSLQLGCLWCPSWVGRGGRANRGRGLCLGRNSCR